MSLKNIFHKLGDEFDVLVGKLPHDWVSATGDLIAGLDKAQSLLSNPSVATVAALFPNGIGVVALADVQKLVCNALPVLEIAQGCEKAIVGITDPDKKADAVLSYLLTNIGKLPQSWQDKHWFNIAETILTTLLGITLSDAKLLLVAKTNGQ